MVGLHDAFHILFETVFRPFALAIFIASFATTAMGPEGDLGPGGATDR